MIPGTGEHGPDNHEVRVYPGWNSSTDLPTGPTILMREDRAAGSYSEVLTMTTTLAVASGRPTGAEAIGSLQSLNLQRLTRITQSTQSGRNASGGEESSRRAFPELPARGPFLL